MTRFVRIQLIIFTIASLIASVVMLFGYLQAGTVLGIGRITVKLELPAAGGLYSFSNVTYRGVEVGRVTDIKPVDGTHVEATLSLETSANIPAASRAQVRSVSAVGEQYVDLQPDNESPPYLRDGSVIAIGQTSIPQRVGPMLDRLSALVDTIPQDNLGLLLDESFKAFNGAGYDFGSLLDSASKITGELNGVADQTRTLIDDSGPLLDSQAQSADSIRLWARSLAGVTDRIAQNDAQVRTVLQQGPGFADEVSSLLTQVKPTLPVLLANLSSVGQILVTYHPSLEQLLVLLPPNVATTQAAAHVNNPTGLPLGDFALTVSDPTACTVGFLPPSSWRSPADTTTIDTPDGLYCKLPQDSPISVRGARNYPCMGHPGKRAPTVQLCDDPKGFEPLAQRQHILGPYPIDPNLISQGVPMDDRVTRNDNLYAPTEGTPLPAGATPAGTPALAPGEVPPPPGEVPPPLPSEAPPASGEVPLPPADGSAPLAAPSAFDTGHSGGGPSVAFASYDPNTGKYMSPDGHMYRQSNLAAAPAPKAWTDMLLGSQ